MGCVERFLNWLFIENIPNSEQSIIRDLMTIGVIEKE
jgi:hypothetical protein